MTIGPLQACDFLSTPSTFCFEKTQCNKIIPSESDILVVDIGSSQTRAGYTRTTASTSTTNLLPDIYFDSILNYYNKHNKQNTESWSTNYAKYFVGNGINYDKSSSCFNSCIRKSPFSSNSVDSSIQSVLNCTAFCPTVNSSILVNPAVTEDIIDFIFDSLIDQSSHGHLENPAPGGVIFSECAGNPPQSRAEILEILFEGYNIPRAFLAIDYLMSAMFAKQNDKLKKFPNRDCPWLIINLGNTACHVQLLLEDASRLPFIKRIDFGGGNAADLIGKLAAQKYSINALNFPSICTKDILKQSCYCKLPSFSSTNWISQIKAEDVKTIYSTEINNTFNNNKPTELIYNNKTLEKRRIQADKMRALAQEKRQAKIKELEIYMCKLEKLINVSSNDTSQLEYESDLNLNLRELDQEFELNNLLTTAKNEFQVLKKKSELYENSKNSVNESYNISNTLKIEDDDRFRLHNFESWLEKLYSERKSLINSVLKREKNISAFNLAKSSKKIRKSHYSITNLLSIALDDNDYNRFPESNDLFGANDSDWDIYISDNRQEEEEQKILDESTRLGKIENLLYVYDKDSFKKTQFLELPPSSFFETFFNGPRSEDYLSDTHNYVHLNIERSRVCEVPFEPSIVGLDQAGLNELIRDAIAHLNRDQLINLSVVITGGWSAQKGMVERLDYIIRSWYPTDLPLPHIYHNISTDEINSASLGAWRGGVFLAQNSNFYSFDDFWITCSWYNENGPFKEYTKNYFLNNR